MTIRTDIAQLSEVKLSTCLRDGSFTVEAIAIALLQRISERNDEVKAWVYSDTDLILKEAKRLDAIPLEKRGPLYGLPVGVKGEAPLLLCSLYSIDEGVIGTDIMLTKGRVHRRLFRANLMRRICQRSTIHPDTSAIVQSLTLPWSRSSGMLMP